MEQVDKRGRGVGGATGGIKCARRGMLVNELEMVQGVYINGWGSKRGKGTVRGGEEEGEEGRVGTRQ